MRIFGLQGENGSDGAGWTWKPSGLASYGGVLYMFMSRQLYGTSGTTWIQAAERSQLVKSTDHGVTLTPLPASNAAPYASPMFPATRFAAPSFVLYGANNAGAVHGGGTYAYAVSPDSSWNNSSSIKLGRCLISALAAQSVADWQYFKGGIGGDVLLSTNWDTDFTLATPILSKSLSVGMTMVQYMPALRRYVMFQWSYPSITAGNTVEKSYYTTWDIYDAKTLAGPWRKVQSRDWGQDGFYNPSILAPTMAADGGLNFQLLTAGDYRSQNVATGKYEITTIAVAVTA